MKDIFKLGGILMVVTVIAASGLAGVYQVTQPRILEQKKKELQNALTLALPGAADDSIYPVEENGRVLYYKAYSAPDTTKLVGFAFITQGAGYSSVIETMVGVDTSGQIIGIKVMSQVETPGLGTKIEEIRYGESEPWFQQQFIGKSAERLAVDKDGGEISSITGATISSRATANSIVEGYRRFRENRE